MAWTAGNRPGEAAATWTEFACPRAVAGRPALLLCDEPTGNLDTASASNVLGLLDSLHSDGIAVVIVTHDSGVAARTRRRLVIADGVITEERAWREQAEA